MVASPPWGHHFILDLAGCDRAVVTDPNALRRWVADLVDVIGMTAFGSPQIAHFGEGDAMAGWTVQQLITTSSIQAHFMDHGDGFLDVFSCRPFELWIVRDQVQRTLRPVAMGWRFFERRAGDVPREVAAGSYDAARV